MNLLLIFIVPNEIREKLNIAAKLFFQIILNKTPVAYAEIKV